MNLAIFDLDNTLLDGDSDHLWGRFLIRIGAVDGPTYERENERFYREYMAGTMDSQAFLRFALRPLRENDPATLHGWHEQFMEEEIKPAILPAGRELIGLHKSRGDHVLIMTATNRFITGPIAAELEVDDLLATEPAMRSGRYTGEVEGQPCFQSGKVKRLQQWTATRERTFDPMWFYSDSINDEPLLAHVQHPVAVDPDPLLKERARARSWPVVSLRRENARNIFQRVARPEARA